MDPNTALRDMRRASQWIRDLYDMNASKAKDMGEQWQVQMNDAAQDLESAASALDSWMRSGGFLPKDWSRNR